MTTTIIAKKRAITAEEYLKMEREGIREMDGKYEFFNNKLRLMAGGTPIITVSIGTLFKR